MTEHEQRTRIQAAANKIGEAWMLLQGTQSRNPGQPLEFNDLWFTANQCATELKRTLYTLKAIKGPNEPAGYEEGQDK